MIADDVLNRQVIRLGALRNRPDYLGDIEDAFREAARNAAHAMRMTDRIVRYSEFFPTPAEVYTAASATASDEDLPKRNRNCPACDGTGWEQVWQLITYQRTPGGGMYKSFDVITDREQAMKLEKMVDGKDQLVYACVRRCTRCGQPPRREEDIQLPPQKRSRRGMQRVSMQDLLRERETEP
jgi:hypothetical protein